MKNQILVVLFLSLLPSSSPASLFAQATPGAGRKYSSIERMHPDRLRGVRADRLRYQRQRHDVRLKTGYQDVRAILHAHAEDSSHTGGTRTEMLASAKKAGVKVIMLTDHVRPERDFINDSWRGLRDGVLFIPGAEHEGYLVYPQASIKGVPWKTREEYVELIKAKGGNIFLCHVEERFDWDTARLDGIEIYNHHTDIKDEGAFLMWLTSSFTDPKRLNELTRSLSEFPEEVIGAQQDYLAPILAKWDQDAQKHRVTGVAANDCHHNQVFTVTCVDASTIELGYITSRPTSRRVTAEQDVRVTELTRNRKPGELIARLDFDPYERSMLYVSTHILINQLEESSVREALRKGRAYVAHDWLCDATGFAFTASARGKRVGVMGDELAPAGGLLLNAETPVGGELRLLHNGKVIKTVRGDKLSYPPREKGVYRIEAWLALDGEMRPWIYSNPIYLR